MDGNNEASASSSMPPPQLGANEETQRYTNEEWEEQRPIIVGMYHMDGMTLKKIADFLLEERGFHATQRQLKRKITTWRLDKNVKDHEMKAIVRKQARLQAKGKTTAAFAVRGKPVEGAKIDRWQKRTGYSDASFLSNQITGSPTPTTPTLSDISYNAISEGGSPSPSIQPTNFEADREHSQLAISQRSNRPISGRSTPFQEFREEGLHGLLGSSPIVINHFTGSVENDFGGQSPAPFTAPPSPVPSFTQWPSTSQQNSITPHQPLNALASSSEHVEQTMNQSVNTTDFNNLSSAHHQFTVPLLSHATTPDPEMPMISRKKRYLQKEEDEHWQRLGALQRQYGTYHPAVLDTLQRLGDILEAQGRYRSAERLFRGLLERSREAFGDEHPSTLSALVRISQVLGDQGQWKTSETLAKKVHTTASKVLSPFDPILLRSKQRWALTLHRTAHYAESRALYQEVISLSGSIRAPDDALILGCLDGVSELLWAAGNYEESEKIAVQVELARSLSLGKDHVLTLQATSALSQILLSQRRFSESETLARQVYASQRKIYGSENPTTLRTQLRLSTCLAGQGRYGEAEVALREVIEKRSKVLGPQHCDTLYSELHMIKILNGQYRYSEAEVLGRELLLLIEKAFGSNSPQFFEALAHIGDTYRGLGRFEEARAMFERAKNDSALHLGSEHPQTTACLERYTLIVQEMEGGMSMVLDSWRG